MDRYILLLKIKPYTYFCLKNLNDTWNFNLHSQKYL